MIRVLFILFFHSLFICSLLSQGNNYNLRNVNIVAGDTIIRTQASNHYPGKKMLPESPYYWYGSGRINVNQGSYSGKLLHGKYEMFDKNNRLIGQGNFDYGLKQGMWIAWFINGTKKEESVYKDGLLTGERLVYAPEGRLISKERFHKGLLHGKSTFYFKDTIIVKEYSDGREVVKTRKPEKVTDEAKSQKRRPVFSRFYKPKISNDTIPAVKPKETEHRIYKKKKQNKDEMPVSNSDKSSQ